LTDILEDEEGLKYRALIRLQPPYSLNQACCREYWRKRVRRSETNRKSCISDGRMRMVANTKYSSVSQRSTSYANNPHRRMPPPTQKKILRALRHAEIQEILALL